MTTENTTDQKVFEETKDQVERGTSHETVAMGVASPSTKRRLGTPEGDHDIVAAKLAKLVRNNNNEPLGIPNHNNNNGSPPTTAGEDSTTVTTDFLTTSILARTLLTSSTVHNGSELLTDPLESLKSTLEALPPVNESLISPFLKPTISSADNDEFSSLLCHEPSLTPVPIVNGITPINPANNVGSWNPILAEDHQVITEEENGKSYFNLGSADATIVARKSSSSPIPWTNGGCGNSSSIDLDDNASSSSCESLSSSEDLFNSGEEFDPSDDEEEEFSSYKQQRSTVLHLSLCKLNKFRSHCVEPSLHRSVLICNTLRHIEQEIKNEDEVDESLKSRERLPSFWRPTSNHHPHCFGSPPPNQPLITDSRPLPPLSSDPYLSPNPYTSPPGNLLSTTGTRDSPSSISNSSSPSSSLTGNNNGSQNQPSYTLYDYTCLRPTPYHTTTYDYEQDLVSLETSSAANSSTLVECDSGYGEELSYYYGSTTTTSPNGAGGTTTRNHTPTTSTTPVSSAPSSLVVDPNSITSPSTNSTSQQQQPSVTSSQFLPFSSSSSQQVQSSNPSPLPLPPPPSSSERLMNNNGDKSEFDTITTTTGEDSDTSSGGSSPPHSEDGTSSLIQNNNNVASWNNSTTSTSKGVLPAQVPVPTSSASSPQPTLPPSSSFANQDSQCGMESRRSSHLNFSSHSMPMDNLISSSYSSSL